MRPTKEKTIIGLGILLVLLPLTGFPHDWKTVMGVIIGIVIIYIGVLFLKIARNNEIAEKQKKEIKTETFTETA